MLGAWGHALAQLARSPAGSHSLSSWLELTLSLSLSLSLSISISISISISLSLYLSIVPPSYWPSRIRPSFTALPVAPWPGL